MAKNNWRIGGKLNSQLKPDNSRSRTTRASGGTRSQYLEASCCPGMTDTYPCGHPQCIPGAACFPCTTGGPHIQCPVGQMWNGSQCIPAFQDTCSFNGVYSYEEWYDDEPGGGYETVSWWSDGSSCNSDQDCYKDCGNCPGIGDCGYEGECGVGPHDNCCFWEDGSC